GQAPFAPGAGAPTGGEGLAGFFVGAPPRCEPARNHSHPGRVLLPVEGGRAVFCRSTASVRTGQAAIRTRRGCSYRGREVDRLFCRSTAPVRTGTQPFAPGAGAPTRGGRSGGFL